MTPKNPYRATGIGSAYIEREADQRLRRELSDNRRFPFIAAAPDSGKTALLRHTAAVLDPSQYCALAVDVSRIRLVSFAQFMGELLLAVAREGDLDKREIHPEAPEDTFLAWLGVFPQRFILMLDGVEALLRADFLNEFLGKLRFLHSVRAENREFSRLQIVLAAATHMNRMVPVGLRSPFAGSLELWLRALTVDQVESLAWSLGTAKIDVDVHVGAVLHRHTGGQPYLCQHILASLWDEAHSNAIGVTAQSIHHAVEDLLDRAPSIEHFARIFRTVSSDPLLVDGFARMLRGETIDPDRLLDLRVTGLVGPDSPYACSLYERVFGPGGPLAIPLPSASVAVSPPEPAEPELPLPPLPVDEEADPAAKSALAPSVSLGPPAPLAPSPLPPSLDLEALAEPPPHPAPEPTPSRDRDEPSLPPVTSSSITPNLFAQPLEIRAPVPPPRTASTVTPVMASRPLPPPVEPRSALSGPAPSAITPVFAPILPTVRPSRPPPAPREPAPVISRPAPAPSEPIPAPSEPIAATSEPAPVSIEPAAATSEPAVATSEPAVATSEPAAATSEPAAATSEPVEATSEPVVATSEPVAATSEPVAATSEPVAATNEPVAATSEPVIATSEPVIATSEPVIATSEPVAATSEPVAATSEPVAATSEPVVATSEPVAATSESVEATSEPVVATSEPVAATSEPVAATSEPVTATSEPVVATSEPVVVTSEPASAISLPIASPAEPVDVTREPASAISPPAASRIEPVAAASAEAVPIAEAERRAQSAVTPTREVPVANMAADIAQSRATPKYGAPLAMPAPVSAPSVPPHADDEGPTQVDAAARRLSAHTPKSLPPGAVQLLDEPSAVERRKELVDVVLSHSEPLLEPLALEPTVPNAPAVPQNVAPVRSGPAVAPPPPAAVDKPASPEPSRGAEPAPRQEPAAPAMATSQPLTVGVGLVLANRYFLTCEIGQGAVAQVWNAYDRIKDEQVALKLLAGPAADNPLLVERFWRSAQQMAALSHPAIVGVLNKPREENGIHYVVMEYLSGDNLRQWVLLNKLTRAHLLRVMQRLAAGLQYAHERRTLHRNIKPSNILFDSTGHARLSDFGLVWPADAAQSKESRADRLIYMAPEEQLGDGQGDARSDVYSLGMCALFALVGKELASSAVTSRASLIESLDAPPQLKSAIKRAVAPNPADRFATAAEFSRALEIDAPALPGVSARHSISVNSELRTSPSQRQPAVAPPSSAAPPQSAPASPPPKSSASLPLPKLSMPEPLFKAEGPAEGDELQPPPGRNPAAIAEYQIETDRIAAIQAEALATRSGTSLREPLPIQPPQRRFPWVLLAGFGALVLVGGGLAGFLLAPGTRHAVSVGTTRPAEPTGGVQRPVVEPLAEPGARGDDKGGERPFVPVPVIPLKTDEPGAGRTTPMVEGLKPGAKPVVQAADAKKAEAPTPAAKPEPGERPADTKLPVVASAQPQPEEEPPPAASKPEPAAKPEPVKPAPVVAKAAPEPVKPAPVVAKAAPEPVKPAPVVAKAAPEPVKPAPVVAKPAPVVAGAVPAKPATEPVKVAKVTPAAKPPKAPPPRAASPTPKAPARVATAARDPMAEKTLNDAQDAFRRGERQTAISMALRVAQRGGAEAAQAWRFVGGAACSIRSPELATTAYRSIREPDQKRLLLDLCQRNGMRLNGHKFELAP